MLFGICFLKFGAMIITNLPVQYYNTQSSWAMPMV